MRLPGYETFVTTVVSASCRLGLSGALTFGDIWMTSHAVVEVGLWDGGGGFVEPPFRLASRLPAGDIT